MTDRTCVIMDVDGEPVKVQTEPGRELSAETREALAGMARAARAKAQEMAMAPGVNVWTAREQRISDVLHLPAGDSNYRGALERLTDYELLHCFDRETRKGGLKQIAREIKRRQERPPRARHNGDPIYQEPPSFYDL